jgi:hypothetical protein
LTKKEYSRPVITSRIASAATRSASFSSSATRRTTKRSEALAPA